MKSLLQFFFSLCFGSFLLGQGTAHTPLHKISGSGVDTAWVRHYGSGLDSSNADASSIVIDASGNVYVTGGSKSYGTSYDYATIKYNAAGDTAWAKRYNGPGNGDDRATAIAVDVSGNVYVTGSSYSGTSDDYTTIKYNAVGDAQWVKRYNGPGNSVDEARSLVVDGSGNMYVTGTSYGELNLHDFATIKYNANGDTLWIKRYTSAWGDDYPSSIALDVDGNAYITGKSVYHFGPAYRFPYYATIKYNTNGDALWWREYSGGGATSLAVDTDDNVFVTGRGNIYNNSATIKYNSNGDTLWVRHFIVNWGHLDLTSLAIDTSGNTYVTGYVWSDLPDDYSANDVTDYVTSVTIKYNTNGDTLWVRIEYNGRWANSLAIDASGNVYITGTIEGNIVTTKYNSMGKEEWIARYSYGTGSTNVPIGIKVDQSGNVYVGGTSSFGNRSVYTVIKYKQTPTAVSEINNTIPSSFALEQNYPNPFNPSTTIRYALPSTALVRLTIHDILGREIATLVNEEQSAGWKEVEWNAKNVSSGIYFYKLVGGNFVKIKRMVFLK